ESIGKRHKRCKGSCSPPYPSFSAPTFHIIWKRADLHGPFTKTACTAAGFTLDAPANQIGGANCRTNKGTRCRANIAQGRPKPAGGPRDGEDFQALDRRDNAVECVSERPARGAAGERRGSVERASGLGRARRAPPSLRLPLGAGSVDASRRPSHR